MQTIQGNTARICADMAMFGAYNRKRKWDYDPRNELKKDGSLRGEPKPRAERAYVRTLKRSLIDKYSS